MRFRIAPSSSAPPNSGLLYRPKEFSFDVTPAPLSGYTSVLLDDLNLEIDETGKVLSIWGLSPYTRWVDAVLSPPKANYGDLFVLLERPLQRGVSVPLASRRYFPTFVDRKSGWVQVRGDSNSTSGVLIIPGVIFEIDHDGQFSSLWLNPQNGLGQTKAA